MCALQLLGKPTLLAKRWPNAPAPCNQVRLGAAGIGLWIVDAVRGLVIGGLTQQREVQVDFRFGKCALGRAEKSVARLSLNDLVRLLLVRWTAPGSQIGDE